MQIHPRTNKVQEAGRELSQALSNIITRFKLSELEVISLLARQMTHASNQALTANRHPMNPEKSMDEK